MLTTFTAYGGALVLAGALLGMAWKAVRALVQFVSAVADNTAAVASLGADLRAHTTATTTALTALDKRVTRLETTP